MTFNLSWACVLVGCISASLAGAYNLSDEFPPLWKESPGQFSDYSVENGKYIINPWNYSERIGMYKILLAQTARYFEKFAPEDEQNILWGLPIHHGWQYHSGRLADPTLRTDCGHDSGDPLCISVDSWWADLNYYLSTIPFLAAIDSGLMGVSADNVILLPPSKDQTNFCYNVSSCHSSFPEAMKMWNKFYKVARFDYFMKNNFHNDDVSNIMDYLAPSLFPTTLDRVCEFQKGLPPRTLVSGDPAHFISDFTDLQNKVLLGLKFLHIMHKYSGTLSLIVWKTLMELKVARKLFLEILEFIVHFLN
uniref:Protein LEG1 homolog n=1 Tax=Marmota marmota marmota TaxID=9994 RepID=A0A8C5ZVV4_MARMA